MPDDSLDIGAGDLLANGISVIVPGRRETPRSLEPPFYADGTIVGPDDGAVDHVRTSILLNQFGQSFKHCLAQVGLGPATISTENALFHLPYSSGNCRHCALVRPIHIMPSK
ncbi:hypothetical protein [Brucella pseudogrignonensis]|uniref:hypothetical protein n=1 Tax=Brucella pseudogrignonensis TaxID=419475 RepID=UPI0038CFCFC5